jgi:MFS family permease
VNDNISYFQVCSVTPSQYFYKKRGVATGIVYAGGGLGGACLSFIIDALIKKLSVEWSFRIVGIATLVFGLPAAWFVKERAPIRRPSFIEWRLLKDIRFVFLFLTGVIGTFPLFVPPFFLPLYTHALGLSSSTGAGAVALFNFSSAVGRLGCGVVSDRIGPVNTLLIGLLLDALSLFVIWPVSESLGPLFFFVFVSGVSNGAFFAVMPLVVGMVFGSARVSVVMGMVVSGWAAGFVMVC